MYWLPATWTLSMIAVSSSSAPAVTGPIVQIAAAKGTIATTARPRVVIDGHDRSARTARMIATPAAAMVNAAKKEGQERKT